MSTTLHDLREEKSHYPYLIRVQSHWMIICFYFTVSSIQDFYYGINVRRLIEAMVLSF